MSKKETIYILAILAVFGIIYRLLPYPPNWTPLGAIALFAGFYFRSRWVFVLPVLMLFLSDLFIGFYDIKIMLTVYLAFALIPFLGFFIKGKQAGLKTIFASFSASIWFFAITNFAVWLFGSWYSRDFAGLLQCYTMAVPFFRSTLFGDLFFSGVIFGSYALYRVLVDSRRGVLVN